MAKTTIEFSDAADRMLDGMTQTLGTTKAETIRNALALYNYLLVELRKEPNYELAIATRADNKVVKAVVVPGLTQVASGAA